MLTLGSNRGFVNNLSFFDIGRNALAMDVDGPRPAN